jgi:hypothetical protein
MPGVCEFVTGMATGWENKPLQKTPLKKIRQRTLRPRSGEQDGQRGKIGTRRRERRKGGQTEGSTTFSMKILRLDRR